MDLFLYKDDFSHFHIYSQNKALPSYVVDGAKVHYVEQCWKRNLLGLEGDDEWLVIQERVYSVV